MVKQIIAAGGIPFVKTNVPQAMLTFECNNPLWGRSVNPYNPGYTCGGSSGGESALLALDGSALVVSDRTLEAVYAYLWRIAVYTASSRVLDDCRRRVLEVCFVLP